jgi:uncharacterized protein with PIN domain
MKVGQILATIPEALPPEYAQAMQQLQSNAPPMGWPFVKRRMRAELGEGWESRFAHFEKEAAAAASLGQVHKATLTDGRVVACKLQYPDMSSVVEADLKQLKLALAIFERLDRTISTGQVQAEIADRMRDLLDDIAPDILSVDEAAARRIETAFARFGRGAHPAGLNFGDMFAYDAAARLGAALLYVGDDFAATDLRPALA